MYLYLDLSTNFHVLVLVLLKINGTCTYLYLDPKYLQNTKYIQIQTGRLHCIQKLYTVYRFWRTL